MPNLIEGCYGERESGNVAFFAVSTHSSAQII